MHVSLFYMILVKSITGVFPNLKCSFYVSFKIGRNSFKNEFICLQMLKYG